MRSASVALHDYHTLTGFNSGYLTPPDAEATRVILVKLLNELLTDTPYKAFAWDRGGLFNSYIIRYFEIDNGNEVPHRTAITPELWETLAYIDLDDIATTVVTYEMKDNWQKTVREIVEGLAEEKRERATASAEIGEEAGE